MSVSHNCLVIDDDITIRYILERILKKEGYELNSAETGEQGWRLFRETDPDLVILDLNLPDISGLEVLKRIRMSDRNTGTKVAFFADREWVHNQNPGYPHEADLYLSKPFESSELISNLKKLLI